MELSVTLAPSATRGIRFKPSIQDVRSFASITTVRLQYSVRIRDSNTSSDAVVMLLLRRNERVAGVLKGLPNVMTGPIEGFRVPLFRATRLAAHSAAMG